MKNAPPLALFISVTSVSFAAILIAAVNYYSPLLHPLAIAFYRLLFTTLLLTPVALFHHPSRQEICVLPRKTILILAGIGFILAMHFSLWITSLTMTSISSSVFLVTAHPVIVAPISFFLLKEALHRLNVVGIILSVCGVFLLVVGNYGFALGGIDSLGGNILAFLGGGAAGLYILGGRIMRKNLSVITYAFLVYFFTTIILFCICLLTNTLFVGLTTFALLLLFIMAVISGIFGHTLYNWALRYVRASMASVALLGEPIGSTLWAFILPLPFLHQIPTVFTLFGGLLILIGIYLTSRKRKEGT